VHLTTAAIGNSGADVITRHLNREPTTNFTDLG